jgi:hypothetical protein
MGRLEIQPFALFAHMENHLPPTMLFRVQIVNWGSLLIAAACCALTAFLANIQIKMEQAPARIVRLEHLQMLQV